MATITGAVVTGPNGQALPADCFGNNLAIICPQCNAAPLLLTARPNQRGSDQAHAVQCGCGATIWMTSAVQDGINVNPVTIAIV